ncbi:hypothetical protein CEF21_04075 [Bacillus sp. FJAT-42376]|uniref:hypothetical protein n=1 Tax=Bacillus sp. FJAT-42376 TaxID=2014076 RepID=UPI000F4EC31A|nr:hypothetical protein [Bacillus sp. FJAT-42376]AZB41539.1 hypothetical protein CEF21_04075 [Bacillus sp. FJAT-42376]
MSSQESCHSYPFDSREKEEEIAFSPEDIAKAYERKYPLFQLLFQFSIPENVMDVLDKLSRDDVEYEKQFNEFPAAFSIWKMYTGFQCKFHRIPNIFIYLVEMIGELNVPMLIRTFHISSIRFALSLDKEIPSIYDRITYGLIFRERLPSVIRHMRQNKRNIHSFAAGIACKYPFENPELEQWVLSKAGKTKNETVLDGIAYWEEPDFPREGSLSMQRAYFALNRKEREWERCKAKYPFSFDTPFMCSINREKADSSRGIAYILEPDDHKQVILGYLTVCCQRLNGSGEASMMEGLINPESGFLVFEKNSNLLAQSWIWLSEDGAVLVLDSIEFAENRSAGDIVELLRLWLKKASYPNIQLGIGFNRTLIGEQVPAEHIKWYKQCWKERYTDAYERIWLKKNGRICI